MGSCVREERGRQLGTRAEHGFLQPAQVMGMGTGTDSPTRWLHNKPKNIQNGQVLTVLDVLG